MTLQSKSFTISKGASLEQIAQFLEREIGLNAFLIRGIKGVSLSTDVTQLTVLYEKYSPEIVDSIAPREGALFTTGVSSDDFDIRFLFNEPVDAQSIASGTFSIDGQPLEADKVFVDPTTNNYFLKVSASGSNFQNNAFHTYQVNDGLRRQDGSSYNYTPVGGYIFHGIASAHLGDYPDEYISRRRGKLAVGVVKLSKNINPQQGISEFLSQRQLSDNRLITYTPISTSTNTVDVYFIYIKTLEPQIISGFPLDNSLLPDVSAPGKVTFVFNTKLDSSKLAATTGLFSIEEGFTTSTDVPPENVTLLPDNQTVEINTSSYFTDQRVYSILAKPGIRSLEGLDKEKPEQWTVHIAPYEASGGITTGVSQDQFDALASLFDGHTGEGSVHFETGDITLSTGQIPDLPPIIDEARFVALSGSFTGFTGDEFASLSSDVTTNTNSISTNASNLVVVSGITETNANNISTNITNIATNTTDINFLSADFTGHTGINSIHYTQSEITNLNVNQLAAGAEGYILTVDGGSASWQPASVAGGGITTGEFTGHTGETGIHFEVTDILLDPDQISTLDVISGYYLASIGQATASFQPIPAASAGDPVISGLFTGHTGETGIHFTLDEIFIPVDQITNFDPGNYALDEDLTSAVAKLDDVSGVVTGHTGETGVHFSVDEIFLGVDQLDPGSNAGYVLTSNGSAASWSPPPAVSGVSSGVFAAHTGDADIHFLEGEINHQNIIGAGSNTHAAIDTHIADITGHTGETGVHYLMSEISVVASQINSADALNGQVLTANGAGGATFTNPEVTQAEFNSLSGTVDTNTNSISTNTTAIAANSGDIITNINSISTNVTAIAANSGDIIANETYITNVSGQLNEADINQNFLIVDNANNIAINTGNIAINSGEIQANITAIAANSGDLVLAVADIAINSGEIIKNTTAIAANSGDLVVAINDIAINSGEIVTNTNNISTNTTAIAANSGDLLVAIGDIATNTTAIAANSGDIISNETYITNVSGQLNTKIGINTSYIAAQNTVILANQAAHQANSGDLTGHTGEINPHLTTLASLNDTSFSTLNEGEILRYDGEVWTNYSTGGESLTNTPIEDLQNVNINYSVFSGETPNSEYTDATGAIIAWNDRSGEWTDFQLMTSAPLSLTILQGEAGAGPALGGNTYLLSFDDGLLASNNFSDVPDKDEARRNLKVRYQIDDIADYGLLRSARNVGGGSSYIVNPDAFTFTETDPMTFGLMTSTNAAATAATAGNARYSDRVAYLVNDFEYYFRVAINRDTNIKVRFGMAYQFNTDATVTGLCPHAVYFEYDSTTDTNWHACATNASTITRVDTNYAATANQWEWMGFMPVSSGVYFFEYQNGTTTGEAQHIAFISSTLMPQAGFKGQRVFVGNIGNGQTYGHMLIDKFAYPLYLDYLPSGLAARF